VKSRGVTKGSFYWHFKNREDFVRSVARYWATSFTFAIIEKVNQQKLKGSKRLLALMKILTEQETARYDLAMRAWGTQEPEVAIILAEVDKRRLNYIRSMFEEMGFEGDELRMRTRAFVICQNSQYSLFLEETLEERLKDMKLRHAFFTRP
jgi:AcrR family transcriptional regulator